jgi:hypothetical protein
VPEGDKIRGPTVPGGGFFKKLQKVDKKQSFGTYAVSVVPRVPEIWPRKTVQGLLVHPVYVTHVTLPYYKNVTLSRCHAKKSKYSSGFRSAQAHWVAKLTGGKGRG